MSPKTQHQSAGCRCPICSSPTIEDVDWEAKHRDHGGFTIEKFDHPSEAMHWMLCKCGAKHLRMGTGQ